MKHKKVKIALIVLLILFLPLAIFIAIDLYHYSQNKSPYRTLFIPRLELGVFEVINLSLDKTDISGKMLIHSPLPFNLRADSLQYRLYISDVEVIKSTYAKSLNIRKWDSSWITLPVSIYNDKLLTILEKEDKRGKDSVYYRVKTTFFTNIPFRQKFNMDVETLQPLFYIPTATIKQVTYDSLSLKGVTLYLDVLIGNRNKFPFVFKDLKYKFALADYPWVSGAKYGVIDIKERDSTEVVLPVRISFTDAFKSLGPLIRKGGKTDYKFGLDLKLVSDNNAMKNSKVILKDAGTVHEIVKLAKEAKREQKEKKREEKERKKLKD